VTFGEARAKHNERLGTLLHKLIEQTMDENLYNPSYQPLVELQAEINRTIAAIIRLNNAQAEAERTGE
jgi:hypothetical protein